MKNPTFTFGDLLMPNHPERKCHLNFQQFQFWHDVNIINENKRVISVLETVFLPHYWMKISGFDSDFNVINSYEYCIWCNNVRK